MGWRSGIRDPESGKNLSRMQRSKRHRTLDPQHWHVFRFGFENWVQPKLVNENLNKIGISKNLGTGTTSLIVRNGTVCDGFLLVGWRKKLSVAGGAAPGERAGPMYGAAVPPPASSTMHPPVDYSMATVSLPIPPYDYGSVVNGPTTEMFMMGHQGRFCFIIEFTI